MSETRASLPEALLQVRTRPLFTLRLAVSQILGVGQTPAGDRRIALVDGGRFEGERLSGEVLGGGSDWLILRPDGAMTLDVRLHLKTDDGALIAMRYQGLRHGPPEVLQRLAAGAPVDPAEYYFRIAASFETASEPHAWLNRIVAVGIGHRLAEGPLYNLFEVA